EPVMVAVQPKKPVQTNRPTKKKINRALNIQTNLFSGGMQQAYTPPKKNGNTNGTAQTNSKSVETTNNLFSELNGNSQVQIQSIPTSPIHTIPEPASFDGELRTFHRNDCLVVDKGWVGHLQEVNTSNSSAI